MEFKAASGTMVGMMRVDKNEEPVTLGAGERVMVTWDRDEAEKTRTEFEGERFTHCEFVDSLNNRYSAPYPGMRMTRRNWRLRPKYVPVRLPAMSTNTEGEPRTNT
jgi:hypothetical protein